MAGHPGGHRADWIISRRRSRRQNRPDGAGRGGNVPADAAVHPGGADDPERSHRAGTDSDWPEYVQRPAQGRSGELHRRSAGADDGDDHADC